MHGIQCIFGYGKRRGIKYIILEIKLSIWSTPYNVLETPFQVSFNWRLVSQVNEPCHEEHQNAIHCTRIKLPC